MDRKKHLDNAVELKDLVYAPLGAISDANIRLSSNIVDFLASTGDMDIDSSGKPVVNLRTIQMVYDQLRSDAMDNTVADRIGLEIPLLSIYPLSSLKVSKTKIAFDAEIKGMKAVEGDLKIYTQVSSRRQRQGSGQARFSYKVELDSTPIPEGLARFIDTLNTQAIPKRIHSKPVDDSGNKLTGRELEEYERQIQLKEQEAELTSKLEEIREMIRIKNNALNLETGMDFEEYQAHLDHLGSTGEEIHPPETYTSIVKYQEISADLESQLDELRREMVMNKVHEDGNEDDTSEARQDNMTEAQMFTRTSLGNENSPPSSADDDAPRCGSQVGLPHEQQDGQAEEPQGGSNEHFSN